jgi:hypothetical protein
VVEDVLFWYVSEKCSPEINKRSKKWAKFSNFPSCLFFMILYLRAQLELLLAQDNPRKRSGYWSHRVDRVLGFFSSRPNWDSTMHSLTRRRACPHHLVQRGGGDTLACERGGSQFQRGDVHCSNVFCAGPPLMTRAYFIRVSFCHITLYLNVRTCIFGTPNIMVKKSYKGFAVIAIVAQNTW